MQPISLRLVMRFNGRNQVHAARSCEDCGGPTTPAAQTTTFLYFEQSVRCLKLVSSCVHCGHWWDDDRFDVENELFEEQARQSVLSRLRAANVFPAIGRGTSVGKS